MRRFSVSTPGGALRRKSLTKGNPPFKMGRNQLGQRIYDTLQFDFLCGGVEHQLLDYSDPQFKTAILRVSPCVVTVVSLDVPPEMTRYNLIGMKNESLTSNQVFCGQGTIIECEKNNAADDKFSTTILTSASLFIRTNGVQPYDIEVDVYLANGARCRGKVLACDFHYNLALVTIQMDTPVQPPILRDLDDTMSINVTEQGHSESFQLRRHSSSFKISSGDKVASLGRSPKSNLGASFGQFSACYPALDCKELYSISSSDRRFQNACGCPIINRHGEVIGIFAAAMTFLPSNIVSRWWNYYKNFKKYCRPWLGLDVANLQLTKLNFLEPLLRTFPNISSGIIVTKVMKDSAAHISGLCTEDVIVQCNGATVRSTLDFFDKIWDKVGEPVELSLLRKGGQMNVKVIIGEATPVNFYRWPVPPWRPNPTVRSSPDSGLDTKMPESTHPE